MPVEVISLLSSSEAGSPPPPQRQRQSPPRQANRLGARRSDSGDFLTSPFSAPLRKLTESSAAERQPSVRAADDDVWTFSDDEAVPSEPIRQPERALTSEPATKRRRFDSYGQDVNSPCKEQPQATTSLACSRPELGQGSGAGRLKPAAEPPMRSGIPRLDSQQPKPRTSWLDDDPFATSSPAMTKVPRSDANSKPATLLLSDLDDDPFADISPQQNQPELAKTKDKIATVDDIDAFASSSPARVPHPADPPRTAVAWDPISSSAPLPAMADDEPAKPSRPYRRIQSEVITLDDSDNDCMEQLNSDEEFPDITDLAATRDRFRSLSKPPVTSSTAKQTKKPRPAGAKAGSAEPKKSALEKEKGKEERAAAREAEKERRRLEKERAKQEKANEKARAAALAEVNKIRTDKKVSTPEMIVDFPVTLDQSVKLQAETLLRDLDVASTSWPSPVENVVKWRRKVRSRYNDNLGHWEPIPERVDRENYAMVIIPAAQFVDLVLGEEQASLESHVLRMKRHFPNNTIIYLLEGLESWLRKNRNIRNRQFVSAVRSGLEPADDQAAPSSSQPQPQRKRKTTTNPRTYIDEESIDQALLQLQVLHGVLIHHTTIPLETARWIAVFTQHISTVPYRRQRDAANDAAFCMETGQVRTGDGPRDTYVRLLQEIGRVTAPIAYGIAAEFGSVPELVRGLEEGGPLTLEKVRKSINKEGEVGERMVGQAVSRRVCKIFLGRDESSTDI